MDYSEHLPEPFLQQSLLQVKRLHLQMDWFLPVQPGAVWCGPIFSGFHKLDDRISGRSCHQDQRVCRSQDTEASYHSPLSEADDSADTQRPFYEHFDGNMDIFSFLLVFTVQSMQTAAENPPFYAQYNGDRKIIS